MTDLGVVREFDDRRGLGTIESAGRVWPFHCSAILDGSRRIDAGAPVAFRVVPGRQGQWEAAAIVKLERPGPSAG